MVLERDQWGSIFYEYFLEILKLKKSNGKICHTLCC